GTIGSNNGITQSSRDFSTQAYAQDGFAMGMLEQLEIQEDGTVVGAFTNGHSRTLAQLVLADFANEQGLTAAGESAYVANGASGQARLIQAGLNNSTSIQSGYLEMSNADLTREFTEMIVAQRGYQAAAKIITTADTLLDEVIRIKR
ncbi:MAG: flagellar hook-basal body complex protein, partial [Candidatus Cloacimonetes bacterium]|nr:flagellar hook-basal body complex protein [Candidatus Cloacimonadota bacterium]